MPAYTILGAAGLGGVVPGMGIPPIICCGDAISGGNSMPGGMMLGCCCMVGGVCWVSGLMGACCLGGEGGAYTSTATSKLPPLLLAGDRKRDRG